MAKKKIQQLNPKQNKQSKAQREKREKMDGQAVLQSFVKKTIRAVVVLVVAIVWMLASFGLAGSFGDTLISLCKLLFGDWYWIALVGLFGIGIAYARFQQNEIIPSQYLGMLIVTLGVFGFIHLFTPFPESTNITREGVGGGYAGLVLGFPLRRMLGGIASGVVLFGLSIIGFVLIFGTNLLGCSYLTAALRFVRHLRSSTIRAAVSARDSLVSRIRGERDGDDVEGEDVKQTFVHRDIPNRRVLEKSDNEPDQMNNVRSGIAVGQQEPLLPEVSKKRFWKHVDIPLDLLSGQSGRAISGDVNHTKEVIRKTFENFGIEVEMGDVSVGPTVTQYTLRPADGVKLSQITGLANDIALAVAAHPIRIEAPIPGKSLVGIEVPNHQIATVSLKEVLGSEEFRRKKTNLTIALGKDVSGKPWIADLGVMPHLLIAGATGSGKSVMINAIIISLLYQNQPDDLKMILVDPKRVEMTPYNDIPHLIAPVITEVDKTINALKWIVGEMDRRFKTLAQAGKRNIESYNVGRTEKMPYLALVIDELADLMAVAAGEVEAAIIRLAQMARAVGIHLVVATQRPSVDIITGLIKANITTRIAFSVASLIDSRTILDTAGAEKLLGRGDMLYLSASLSKPKRLQGVFVSDEEIGRVTGYLKESFGGAQYESEVVDKIREGYGVGSGAQRGEDSLLPAARELVLTTKQASTSFLQRRLSIGYSRAARLMDLLEAEGTIGPFDGAKSRKVFGSIAIDTQSGSFASDDEIESVQDEHPNDDEVSEAEEAEDDEERLVIGDDKNGQTDKEDARRTFGRV